MARSWRHLLIALDEKAISKQIKADQAVVSLAEKLNDSLEFATDAEKIGSTLKIVEPVIIELFKHIEKCCVFIESYTKNGFASESTFVVVC